MATESKQNLLPNLQTWVWMTIGVIVLFTVGLFEQRTRFTLNDGTVITGKVVEEDETTVTIQRASDYIETLDRSAIKDRNWWNVEVDLRLGLDLKGGTSLRYTLDLQDPDPAKNRETLDTTVSTFRDRLDSFGVAEISVVASPPADILVELPGVTMEESLAFEQVIQRLGTFQFMIVAQNAVADNLDVEKERTKVKAAWDELKKTQPLATPRSLNLGQFDIVGASQRIYRWYPYSQRAIEEGNCDPSFPFAMLEISPDAKHKFEGDSIADTVPDLDAAGRPALGFRMRADRAADFEDFTTKYQNRLMAIVLDQQIHSSPQLKNPIGERGIIEGGARGFKTSELQALTSVFRSGSLKATPTLLSKSTIGPSLGEASIRRGVIAGAIASIVVVGFILWFYGFIGVLSSLTLVAGTYFLVGGLGFLEATLTMPGIAGIVLTIGMAIDQNILVNERIREERQKGKTIPQSIKNGFERAFVTIFDAQATTFLTGWILYANGTGPIKGFAVSLMLGIVVTMYAAIVGQKIMFAYGLEHGWFKDLKLRHLYANLNIPFTRYFRKCAIGSIVVCGAGLVYFLTEYPALRGLDFAGGFQVRVRLAQPLDQGEVEALAHTQFASATVVSMAAVDGASAGRDYQVKIRAEDDASNETEDLRTVYLDRMSQAFAGKLAPEGIEKLTITPDAANRSKVAFQLTLDRAVPASLVESRLRSDLAVATFAPTDGESQAFEVALDYSHVPTDEEVTTAVSSALKDLPGNVRLSDPMPESLFIGTKVGKELRDKAIIAMVLSILGILLYVRVRFRDFAWGLAACVALVHDVSIALGGMAVVHTLGIVDCELDYVTIGAILTLIGFSLNDTIVIFDRVRENKQRNPSKPLLEIIDDSVNQTMSRTILTSLTVFFSLLVLFVVNFGQRNVLEGFSFVMLIGVLSGTYSTIYIASPMLWWLTERKRAPAGGAPATTSKAIAASTTE